MKLIDSAHDVMSRFGMEFLHEVRSCVFQKDSPELKYGSLKIGPFKSGSKVELPNWVIDVLLHEQIVEISPENEYESSRNLQNIRWNEEQYPHKMQAIPPFLYQALCRKIARLQNDKTILDKRRYDEIERTQKMLPFLVETRLLKILRVANSGALREKQSDMTLEERWLGEQLSLLLTNWRQELME
ncbi:MAG: hypothetical protein BAJATHORv1_20462 [Candidatus Thorarchaeota archaeon]|nr:MAG: hypothetical protein BAJATHORv1_20462 [Candidatus Thorarchaeota archaeon]